MPNEIGLRDDCCCTKAVQLPECCEQERPAVCIDDTNCACHAALSHVLFVEGFYNLKTYYTKEQYLDMKGFIFDGLVTPPPSPPLQESLT